MKDESLFNLTDISDIPQEIKTDMSKKKRKIKSRLVEDILFLLDMKNEISIDEFLVGLYRLTKERVERKKLVSILNNMRTRKMIIGSTLTGFQISREDTE